MKPTTFVFGAGVSMPFGLPSGNGLMREIASLIVDKEDLEDKELEYINPNPEHPLDKYRVSNLIDAINHCELNSIDRLVQDRPELGEIASKCIAHVLLTYESKRMKYVTDPNYKSKKYGHAGDSVFRYLWNAFAGDDSIEDSETTFDAFKKHRFVTFNYDRLFEHFLFNVLTHNLKKPPMEAIKYINEEAAICHVYGSLGEYSILKEYNNDDVFKQVDNRPQLENAAQSIKLVRTEKIKIDTDQIISKYFDETDQVIVLGFGYDDTNCRLLNACYVHSHSPDNDRVEQMAQSWYGSMYKKEKAEVEDARYILNLKKENVGDYESTDVLFLRKMINKYPSP